MWTTLLYSRNYHNLGNQLYFELQNEKKEHTYTKPSTWRLIAALCIISKTRKQPECPSVGEWINHSPSDDEISLSDKNTWALIHEKTCGKFKCLLPSKKPIWKGPVLYASNSMTFWKRQSYRDSKKKKKKKSVVARGWGGRTEEAEPRGCFWPCICSVRHCAGGQRSLNICPNPQTLRHQRDP